MIRRALLALGLALAAGPAPADWSGFYRPSAAAAAVARAPEAAGPVERGLCVNAILRAQLRYDIPGNLLLGIGIQEAGVTRGGRLTIWPWAVNAAGEGRLFDSRAAALDWIAARRAAGVSSIDVGCMQINMRWHPDAFRDTAQGFDPAVNVDYAARFLRGLYEELGDWTAAAGAYHSRTPEAQQVYLASLRRNVAVANDRISSFRDLAAAAPRQAMPAAPAVPARRGGWSRGGGGDSFGLYSDAPIQPVLPRFSGRS
ncbi:lytic transglycosylase domain-containing protein [Limimaricola pyoseonensis]|uniref:Transglycosylase SLT domain-containing protein n=1 Tax=Limimaricola pyoseonensis TaxID=521013 RepID=A0A1G7KCX3_9RHOB|nr:lytic transglycosylase domain-containing protein [Limimaricola pyoseonensis]SDF35083.1 Transglycosylase SLT domain-containing protein [Limimaricola pyoseonensis]